MKKINIIFFLSLFLINNCSQEEKKISVIKETRQDLEMISAYKEGYNALDQGDPFFAAKKFLEAELLFPQSEWAPKSSFPLFLIRFKVLKIIFFLGDKFFFPTKPEIPHIFIFS